MKKSILRSGFSAVLLSAVLVFTSFASAKAVRNHANFGFKSIGKFVAGSYKELLIQIDEINDKNFQDIRNAIEAGGGVVYKGYCSNLHVLMYLVNRDMHPDNSFLDKLSIMGISYTIKEGTIAQVCSDCGMEPIATPDIDHETE